MKKLNERCGMCLRPLPLARPRRGRVPTYCRECAKRRKTEQSRLNMARMRARRQVAGSN